MKDRFHPKVSTAAALLLEKHYQTCRAQRNTTVHITVRFFESLIRLSQAHARLMHRNTVTISDAVSIILLMESSALRCGGMNPSFENDGPGLIYCEPLHTDFPDSNEADEQFLLDQSRLLRRYDLLHHIPKDQQRDEEEMCTSVEADIDAQVSAIYDKDGHCFSPMDHTSQAQYSQIEDSYGRKLWKQNTTTLFSPKGPQIPPNQRNAD